MSNKKLIVLGLLAVVMIVWATLQSKVTNKPAVSEQKTITYLIGGLEPSLVATITLSSDKGKVSFNRQEERGYSVAEKDGYPVNTAQINDLFRRISDIQKVEFVTNNSANFADLGVSEDKASMAIKFFEKDHKLITGVIISKPQENNITYVRLADSNDVYIVNYAPYIRGSAMDYIDKKILEAKIDDIVSVAVASPEGNYALKAEPNITSVKLGGGMPAGKQFKGGDYMQVFTALSSLQFSNVMKQSSLPKDVVFNRKYVCRLKDSTVYTLDIGINGEKKVIKCKAEFTDKTEVVKEQQQESQEELKKKEAKLLARDAVEQFNKKNSGWVYELDESKATWLTKNLTDLLEDIPKPETPKDINDANAPKETKASVS